MVQSPNRIDYITPEGERRMRRELHQLWHEERPRLAHAVSVAAAEGDRSENAEYIYGKKKLRELDRRIRFLSKRLEELTVAVEDGERRQDKVYFGAWVRLEDEDGGEFEYRIVGADEVDMHEGGISIDSPMARALLGKSMDDEALVKRPKGDALFTVLAIRYKTG